MGFQVNLFDEGIPEVFMIAKKLQNHKVKMYKKCGNRDCKEEILNKPNKHFCWIHLMDLTEQHTPLFPLQTQAPTIHS